MSILIALLCRILALVFPQVSSALWPVIVEIIQEIIAWISSHEEYKQGQAATKIQGHVKLLTQSNNPRV